MGPRLFFRCAAAGGVVALACAWPSAAYAQGFNLNRFEPAERGSRWFALDSLEIHGHARPAAGLTVDYQYQPLALKKNDDAVAAVVGHVVTVDAGASVVLWDRVRLGASLPVVLYNEGDTTSLHHEPLYAPQDHQGIGDLRLGADLRLYGKNNGPITLALGGRIWLPTGSPTSYTSDGRVRGGPRFAAAGKVGRFVYAASTGIVFRDPEKGVFAGAPIDHDFVFGAAAGVAPVDRLVVGPELFGSTTIGDNAFKTRTTPIEALLGAHLDLGYDLRVGLGVGKSLAAGYGSPEVRLVGAIEWAPAMPVEAQPPPPPPPPQDTDGDGIPDQEDACPDSNGKRTNDPRTNGCDDSDGDGIADSLDACETVPGVASSDPKKNGCPADKDGDGVPDATDACPTVAGVASSDPKLNGCPDLDRDKDGIPNDKDACPDAAGPSHPSPLRNGCPLAFLRGKEIATLQQIAFKDGAADLDESAATVAVLEAVKNVLDTHPEIEKVRIEVHTDNRGDAAANKRLSEGRASAIEVWLSGHGIAMTRLSSVGWGGERPIEPNDTEEGRAANRRVEFHVEAQAPSPPAPAK